MSTKALKKQLMAAIAMVIVAAVALSSATYAWFANNNKVTADGISLTAQSEGVMLIIGATQADLANKVTSATLTTNNKGENLYPVHPIYTADSTITAWNHAFSDKYDAAISNSTEEPIDPADKGKYYLETSVWIKLDNQTSDASVSNLRASKVELTGMTDNLLPSARVLMMVENQVKGVYANGQWIATDGSADGTTPFTKTTLTADAVGAPVLDESLAVGDEVEVKLFVYFDGRDDACNSLNFDASTVNVKLEFTADIPTV